MFEGLGISRTDEQIYVQLLRDGPSTVDGLATQTGLSRRVVRVSVERLSATGLAQVSGQIYPVPVDVGVENLVRQREQDLGQIRRNASRLNAELRSRAHDDHDDQVVVLSESLALRELHLAVQVELRLLVQSPETMSRTVILPGRAVIDATADASQLGSGIQIRLAHGVPANLALADDRTALLPLERASLLVRPGNLLNALGALFEAMWTVATPLAPLSSLDVLDEHDRALLSLLVAGMTDDAAGARLGMSRRTVARRVARLMHVTGAHSRMQLGWWAREREWLS